MVGESRVWNIRVKWVRRNVAVEGKAFLHAGLMWRFKESGGGNWRTTALTALRTQG